MFYKEYLLSIFTLYTWITFTIDMILEKQFNVKFVKINITFKKYLDMNVVTNIFAHIVFMSTIYNTYYTRQTMDLLARVVVVIFATRISPGMYIIKTLILTLVHRQRMTSIKKSLRIKFDSEECMSESHY